MVKCVVSRDEADFGEEELPRGSLFNGGRSPTGSSKSWMLAISESSVVAFRYTGKGAVTSRLQHGKRL